MAVSKYQDQVFNGRWKFIGSNTFENIYNGKTFTTTSSNCQHIFHNRTTIDNLIRYQISGMRFAPRKRKTVAYCISQKRRILE